jgi:hypothetical protein
MEPPVHGDPQSSGNERRETNTYERDQENQPEPSGHPASLTMTQMSANGVPKPPAQSISPARPVETAFLYQKNNDADPYKASSRGDLGVSSHS